MVANHHQLLQCYYNAGILFPPKLQLISGVIEFYSETYNDDIQKAVEGKMLDKSNTTATNKLSYKGTMYETGMYVVVDEGIDGFVFGRIILILIKDSTHVYFVVENHSSIHNISCGMYCWFKGEIVTCCVEIHSLLDHYQETPLMESTT